MQHRTELVDATIFEKVLKEQKSKILKEINEAEIPSEDYSGDDADMNTAFLANNMRLEFLRRSNVTLKRIEFALQKIRENRFGICDTCAEPIESRRVYSRPFVNYCIVCQENEETRKHQCGQNKRDLNLS